MKFRPNLSSAGVILGFASVFCLFARRERKPQADDAETLLQLAQQEMREAQAKNRERAVQAITAKNHLQALADQTRRMVTGLTEKAEAAEQAGDLDKIPGMLEEKAKYTQTLSETEASLERATQTTEAVKTAMRREEERIRAMTAKALAMKAQQKEAELAFTIEKSCLSMTSSFADDLFKRAAVRIGQAQARRDLMMQIRQTVEVLDEAIYAARQAGNEAGGKSLTDARDSLKEAALNPVLWQS